MIQIPASIVDWIKTFNRMCCERDMTCPLVLGMSQVSTKTTVVNFSVKQLGLEAQLLGIVVQRERPSLEHQSSELTVKVSLSSSGP